MPAATQLATIEPSPWTVPTARTRSPPLSDSHEPPNDVPLSVRTVCPWIVKVISGQLPSTVSIAPPMASVAPSGGAAGGATTISPLPKPTRPAGAKTTSTGGAPAGGGPTGKVNVSPDPKAPQASDWAGMYETVMPSWLRLADVCPRLIDGEVGLKPATSSRSLHAAVNA